MLGKSRVFHVRELAELSKVVHELVSQIRGGDIMLLTGELGSGKTTFVQTLARELGVVGEVASPSFTIATEYTGGSIPRLVHIDLYRLAETQVANEGVVQQILTETAPDTLTIVEWADRLGVLQTQIRQPVWELHFQHTGGESERIITVQAWPNR